MSMFLRPYRGVAKIQRTQKLFLAWWPFAIIGFNTCSNSYLVDLLAASEIADPLPLILTMRRYRGRYSLEPSPPIEAPIVVPRSVGPSTIIDMIYRVKSEIEVRRNRATETQRLTSYTQRAVPWNPPATLEDAVMNPISRAILSEILSSICVSSDSARITSYNPVHILVGIGRDMREFSMYMDRRVRSVNHEAYVLTNESIRALIERYMRIGI